MRPARTPLAIPSWLPLPWRAIGPLTNFLLARGMQVRASDEGTIKAPAGSPDFRVLCLGDIALTRPPSDGYASMLAGLQSLIERADLVTANLEAMPTTRAERAGHTGSFLRADPVALGALPARGRWVLSLANNHALDFGPGAMSDAIDHLRAHDAACCGYVDRGGEQVSAIATRPGPRVAVLGFCDDHYPLPSGEANVRPALAEAESIRSSILRARREADIVLVNLHWGYEFSLHPLLRHRDLARQLVDWGANAVLCHHAHVPMGVELWKSGIIAYGLGNCVMPRSEYQIRGHPWTGRSFALELGFCSTDIVSARMHPFFVDTEGRVTTMRDGAERKRFLNGLATASARLQDTGFLRRLERQRMAEEAVALIGALEQAARSADALRERIDTLALPRQRALLEFVDKDFPEWNVGRTLGGLALSDTPPEQVVNGYAAISGKLAEAATRLGRLISNATRLAARTP